MALILCQNGKGKFRLWCNTTDKWASPLLGELDMAKRLIDDEYEPHTFEEAFKRIRRIKEKVNGVWNYNKAHLDWLKSFDSKLKQRGAK